MKNFKFNIKLLSIAMTGIILVGGCSSKNDYDLSKDKSSNSNNVSIDTIVENEDYQTEEETAFSSTEESNTQISEQEQIESTSQMIIEETTTNSSTEQKSNDNIVIEEINSLKNQIVKIVNSDTATQFKEDCKDIFITLVDFIFYEGEIRGITFEELSDEAKQQILILTSQIDNLIIKKFPNYKEEISDLTSSAYNKASEIIHNGAENIKEFSKEKLGEENYNKIKTFKDNVKGEISNTWDDLKDDVVDIYDSGKEKIKDWYQNFKNSID